MKQALEVLDSMEPVGESVPSLVPCNEPGPTQETPENDGANGVFSGAGFGAKQCLSDKLQKTQENSEMPCFTRATKHLDKKETRLQFLANGQYGEDRIRTCGGVTTSTV